MPHIALIGDYDAEVVAHQAIPRALELAANLLEVRLDWDWIRTDSLDADPTTVLGPYSGFWCVPASPYASFEGALAAIRFARESGRPFLGTCGGFQHAVIEHARNVLGMTAASHAEVDPGAEGSVIVPLVCSLVEKSGSVVPGVGTQFAGYCGDLALTERYHCSYGLDPAHVERLQSSALRVSAYDEDGQVRAVELTDHPFFMATLFQPERAALDGQLHPLIAAFVGAVTAVAPPRPTPLAFT
ncbi:MAG: hypothetical protein SGI84_02460 [Gemmatimonadota bacterium]|nr:hypothetical protein [Gemmatimonadota bacterium]